jgi:hypothetical protein
MNHRTLVRKNVKWAAASVTVSMSVRLFFVLQLIAAFLLFFLVFASVAVTMPVVFVVDYGGQMVFSHAEAYLKSFGGRVRQVGGLSTTQQLPRC